MMMPTLRKTAFRLLAFWTALHLTGCITCRETFAGHDADHVWTAMVAVAKTPDYNDKAYNKRWTVRENNVWVNDEERRIEIQRRLERTLYRAGAKPLHEQRDWKFQVTMTDLDPPQAKFTSREIGVPSHAWDEAARYFGEVWDMLQGAAAGSSTAAEAPAPRAAPAPPPRAAGQTPPAVQPAPTTQPQQDQPIIDIESLEPQKP
jgi:hypothetical protein